MVAGMGKPQEQPLRETSKRPLLCFRLHGKHPSTPGFGGGLSTYSQLGLCLGKPHPHEAVLGCGQLRGWVGGSLVGPRSGGHPQRTGPLPCSVVPRPGEPRPAAG